VKIFIPEFIAMLVTGLLAGAFMYGLLNVVPTFYEVPVDVHIIYRTRLMTHNSVTMQFLMGASIVAPLVYAGMNRHAQGGMLTALLSSIFALCCLLVTRFGNVPINQVIKTWPPDYPPLNWRALLHTWDRYNLIRTLAALGSFVSFIIATRLFRHTATIQ